MNGGALFSYGATTGASKNGAFLQTQVGVGLGESVSSKVQGSVSISLKGVSK